MSLISAEMRDSIGTVLGVRVSFPVSESDIRRWAVAVYWPDPPPREFWDVDYARSIRRRGFVAPSEFNPFAWMLADQEAFDPMPLPALPFRLNGGIAVEYGEPIRPGDVITGVRTIADYAERVGRHGPMLFTVTADRWTNQADDFVKLHHFTTIHYGNEDGHYGSEDG